jgi:hypothetical protein
MALFFNFYIIFISHLFYVSVPLFCCFLLTNVYIKYRLFLRVTKLYNLVIICWFIIIIYHALIINIVFKRKISENVTITLSQKNDALFTFVVTHYYLITRK